MWHRAIWISARTGDRGAGAGRGHDGFTLIEVLVALTIVAFAFVGLLGLHNRNLAMVAKDQDLTRATLLARQFITEMELIEQFPDVGTSRGDFANAPGFSWERDVQDTELPTVRRVDLRIIWDERQPNACELIYYIRDRREPDNTNTVQQ
jgi:general secretion pathway protein I